MHVADHASYVCGKSACRDDTACDRINQLLFCPLRIFGDKADNRNSARAHLFEKVNDGTLVGLNADKGLLNTQSLHLVLDTTEKFPCAFKEKTAVASDVGLALCTVDDEGVNRFVGRKFDVSGETSTTHANNACLTDSFNDLLLCRV